MVKTVRDALGKESADSVPLKGRTVTGQPRAGCGGGGEMRRRLETLRPLRRHRWHKDNPDDVPRAGPIWRRGTWI